MAFVHFEEMRPNIPKFALWRYFDIEIQTIDRYNEIIYFRISAVCMQYAEKS